MSLSSDVRVALAANSRIEIVGVRDNKHLPDLWMGWAHTVTVIVAPTTPMTSTKKLQALMMSLVPQKPTAVDKFWGGGGSISFGKLYFDEIIGEVIEDSVRDFMITDGGFDPGEKFTDGKLKIEHHEAILLRRRTWVYLYPSIGFAQRVYESHTDKYQARVSDLDRPTMRTRLLQQ